MAERFIDMNGGMDLLLYSVIMFLTTALLLLLGASIYRGKTNLIHSYHQTRVTDQSGYGKAFGKAMFALAMAPLLSGIIGILGKSDTIVLIAVAILIIGTAAGMGCIVSVQRKYNKGGF